MEDLRDFGSELARIASPPPPPEMGLLMEDLNTSVLSSSRIHPPPELEVLMEDLGILVLSFPERTVKGTGAWTLSLYPPGYPLVLFVKRSDRCNIATPL